MFGPVQDVRIPYQQKRMFGFVTFVYAETVKVILSKGNPHFVCDARVLVKPYKEKGKVPDRFRSVPSPLPCLRCISSSSILLFTLHCTQVACLFQQLLFGSYLKKTFFSSLYLSFCLVAGSCSTRTMAPSSPVARRPPDCWIPGTPTISSSPRSVSSN